MIKHVDENNFFILPAPRHNFTFFSASVFVLLQMAILGSYALLFQLCVSCFFQQFHCQWMPSVVSVSEEMVATVIGLLCQLIAKMKNDSSCELEIWSWQTFCCDSTIVWFYSGLVRYISAIYIGDIYRIYIRYFRYRIFSIFSKLDPHFSALLYYRM